MRLALICALVAVVAIVAWVGHDGDDSATTTTAPVTHTNGSPAVWERIETGTDCAALQAEWDQAMDNAEARQPGDELRGLSLDYAAAASQRMRDLEC